MRPLLSLAVMLGLAAVAPATLPGQAVPNLTGTWVLQTDRSDFGPMPPPQSRTDVIEHQEPRLSIKRTASTPNGDVTTDLLYLVDGKPHHNMVGTNEVTSTLHWEGGTLIMVSILQTGQGEVTISDRISLSEDGATMTMSRTLAMGGQEAAQTMVFARR